MTIRVHHADALVWRWIGDIPLGWMRPHIDASEQAGRLAFHEPGDTDTMQLMEMRLDPHTLVAPHAHDADEIFYVVAGELRWQDKALAAGGSMLIPAGTTYSFRIGDAPATLLNFRARADHSFRPVGEG